MYLITDISYVLVYFKTEGHVFLFVSQIGALLFAVAFAYLVVLGIFVSLFTSMLSSRSVSPFEEDIFIYVCVFFMITIVFYFGLTIYFWLVVHQVYKETKDNQEMASVEQCEPE